MKCHDCKYWSPIDALASERALNSVVLAKGYCFRYPPVPTLPVVADLWCGEWKEKSQQQPKRGK